MQARAKWRNARSTASNSSPLLVSAPNEQSSLALAATANLVEHALFSILKRRGGLGQGLAGIIADGNQFGDLLARAPALGGRGSGGLQHMGRNDAAEGLARDTRVHDRLLP